MLTTATEAFISFFIWPSLPPGAVCANQQHLAEETGGGGGEGDPESVQERPPAAWRGREGRAGACEWYLRLVPPGGGGASEPTGPSI